MKKENPFTLMFGRPPRTLVSRDNNLSEIIESFSGTHPVSQTYLISGVRGSGKTVLMTEVEKRLAESGDWITVDLNINQDLMEDLANRLKDACKRIPNYFEKGLDISAFGFSIGIGGADTNRDSVSVTENLLEYARRKGKRVLICIDEVTNGKNMRVFASQFQIFARRDFPVFLLMTGLYENIYSIQNDPSLTFLLRSPKIDLGPLNLRQNTGQYRRLLGMEEEEARACAELTKGYAFAFQALGMLCYEYREELAWEEILEKLDSLLDEFVYRKIWAALSEREQQIMRVVPEDGDIRTAEICERCDMKQSSFSTYRDRLIRKGLICKSKYGSVAMALPRFKAVTQEYGEYQ